MAEEGKIEERARRLCQDIRELSLGTSGEIERIEGAPSSLRFLRDFVLPNKPCIISSAIGHWPALTLWTNSYLRSSLAGRWVSVHSTPDGLADAVADLDRLSAVESTTFSCMVEPRDTSSSNVVVEEGTGDASRVLPANFPADHRRPVCDVSSLMEESGPFGASSPPKDLVITQSVRCGSESSSLRTKAARCSDDLAPMQGENGVLSISSSPHEVFSVASPTGYNGSCVLKGDQDAAHDLKPKEARSGRAWFVTAHVDRVLFPTALDMILHSEIGIRVAYAQEQNGCFLSEYNALSPDAEEHLPWATEAFGSLPEAVNLWIGNEKAVTSFHKDHYENLYAVIAGEKHFTLLPPTDIHRLYVHQYPCARYVKHNDKFAIQQDKPVQFVPWSSVDPYPAAESVAEAKARFPEYFNGPEPFTCTLRKGEILYLPSLWFHHVRQSPDREGRTIALNFWYDMQFDMKYAYYNFLESLVLKSETDNVY